MLHFDPIIPSSPSAPLAQVTTLEVPTEASLHTSSKVVKGQPHKIVLLLTALLDIVSVDGRRHTLRAL